MTKLNFLLSMCTQTQNEKSGKFSVGSRRKNKIIFHLLQLIHSLTRHFIISYLIGALAANDNLSTYL